MKPILDRAEKKSAALGVGSPEKQWASLAAFVFFHTRTHTHNSNVYQTDGYFGGHKDHLALTVLMPLTSPDSFGGGGTGFWAGNRNVDENPQSPPSAILKPPAGSALVFGGDVTHCGMPVEAGLRSVFVCSFSTRTPVSSEDRLHGMQAPPVTSPNFKGSI